jgi:hypothetical protein
MDRWSTLSALVVASLLAVVALGGAIRRTHRPNRATAATPAVDTSAAADGRPAPADDALPPTAAAPPSEKANERVIATAPRLTVPAASAVDEATMMAELREMRQSDPELSLRMAREGNERFPASADAAERATIVVKSLMRMGRAEEATAEARAMVAKYPGTMWAADVQHHMLDIPSYAPEAASP